MSDQINYYEVLGVPRSASRSEIRNAYRRLAKERHPDHAGGSETEFSRLQEAHAVLSDPNRRSQHDQDLDLAHAADQLAGQDFDPEPVTWRTAIFSFVGAFLAFIVVGQIGLWATGANVPPGFASPWVLALRSEEHTSELQSPCNLVCRLLLEK